MDVVFKMYKTGISRVICCLCFCLSYEKTFADFFTDSKQYITLKSFYNHRDYDDDNGNTNVWAQGGIYKFTSGYTNTTIQMGLDASIKYGIATQDNVNKNMITSYESGYYKKNYLFKPGATIKLKYHDSELKIGEFYSDMNFYATGGDPFLPGTFWGVRFNQNINANWSFSLAQLYRGSRPYDDHLLKISPSSIPYTSTYQESDHQNQLGVKYKKDQLNVNYDFLQLKDMYFYHFLNVNTKLPQDINLNVKLMKTDDDGSKLYGNIDAGLAGLLLSKNVGQQTFSLGYQHIFGDYSYNNYGGLLSRNLFIGNTVGNSGRAIDENSYYALYDYDFSKKGIDGLKTQLFYIYGNNITYKQLKDRSEQEYGANITYLVPTGKYKGFGVKMVYTDYKNTYTYRDYQDLRTWLYYQKTF